MSREELKVHRSLIEHFYGEDGGDIAAPAIAARTGLGVGVVEQVLVWLHAGRKIDVADSEEGGIDRVVGVPYAVAVQAHPAFMEEAWRRRSEADSRP